MLLRVLPLTLMLCSLGLSGLALTSRVEWSTALRLVGGVLLVVPCAALPVLRFSAASHRRGTRRVLVIGSILTGFFASTLLSGSARWGWSISSTLLSCGLISAIVSAGATACLFPARRQRTLAIGLLVLLILGALAAVAIWIFESLSDLSGIH